MHQHCEGAQQIAAVYSPGLWEPSPSPSGFVSGAPPKIRECSSEVQRDVPPFGIEVDPASAGHRRPLGAAKAALPKAAKAVCVQFLGIRKGRSIIMLRVIRDRTGVEEA